MFARLGGFAHRFRWFIVAGWILAAILVTLLAPSIDSVAVNDQRAFLAKSAPSLDAVAVVKKEFPGRISPSSAVLVFDAGKGNNVATGEAWTFVGSVTDWLNGAEKPNAVDRVVSPTTADEQTAKALISKDGQVALVVVTFSAIGTEPITREALAAIDVQLEKAPKGVSTSVTGDAAIISAYDQATKKSLDSTTWITILLVVLILLLVYRSPVSPLIPLVTIALAYLISRGVVAVLGNSVMTISGYTNIFLLVILFGAGTDYCLFLISRFREEMADVHVAARAVPATVRTVGETIASSAGTVVVGLSTMAFAELGLFNTTGPSVAVGVVIALAAGLTLTPALLSILGDRTFWPRKARHIKEGRFWHSWSGTVTSHPWWALIGTLVVLLPLAVYGQGQTRDFDLLGDLPESMPAHQGFHVLADHLGPGVMQPLNVVITGPAPGATAGAGDASGGVTAGAGATGATANDFTTPAGLQRIDQIQARLAKVANVQSVTSFTGQLAAGGTLSVEKQLAGYAKGVSDGATQLTAALGSGPPVTATQLGPQLQEAAKGLLAIYSYLQQLGTAYSDVATSADYQKATGALTAIALAAGVTSAGAESTKAPAELAAAAPQIVAGLGDLGTALGGLQKTFAATPGAMMLPETYVATNAGLKDLKAGYISTDGTATRYQVVLKVGPYDPEAFTAVADLRAATTELGGGVVEGASAIVTDLQDASNRDMVRAILFVLAGIFVVLVLLLRALVAPLYLIFTILVSYGATLGIVRVVFSDLLHKPGVTWWVPIFMFVMLVALGMDYNIFLMGRVKEEVAKSGDRDGVRTAVAKTGGIITSAGIIMAGTFAAMMSGSILGLQQIGFAVAVGVLLDTFVVRTALVPAIAVLLGRWSWWPRRRRDTPTPR
jgi:RND superfamily putative drug exporter